LSQKLTFLRKVKSKAKIILKKNIFYIDNDYKLKPSGYPMEERSGRLSDLEENVKHYSKALEFGPPKRRALKEYLISNWQFYKRKTEDAKTEIIRLKHEGKMNNYWKSYDSLFIKASNMMHRNH
jgi:hypothetical protein